MSIKKILQELQDNLEDVLKETSVGHALWANFIELHPADIADFLSELDREHSFRLFMQLPKQLRMEVFKKLSDVAKVYNLSHMTDHEVADTFHSLSADELTDLFDQFSDEELKKYLRLLQKNVRDKVLSLLQFDPESAGGVMNADVVSLMEDFTVEKSIKLLQRLSPNKDVHQQIFVVDKDHRLVGHINLQDLVLQKPHERISQFMLKNELIARAGEDRENIAKKMIHYGLMTIPVIDDENHFLGVIPSETLVDVIVEEAGEDVARMVGSLPGMKQSYFDTPLLRLCLQRSYVLTGLFIAESFSGPIIRSFEHAMPFILHSMIITIISAGGNTGSQASAVVIQGLASGDLTIDSLFRLLRREMIVSSIISLVLSLLGFARVLFIGGTVLESLAFGVSVALVVFISAMLGSTIPFILRRINVDPAFSAGPFLATIMDILGIIIYFYISVWILSLPFK